jgi:hypothetical protein
MSTAPKPQKQPWLDYLLDVISKEPDAVVKDSASMFTGIANQVKAGLITRDKALVQLTDLRNAVLEKTVTAKHRVEKILDGTIEFTLKEFKD